MTILILCRVLKKVHSKHMALPCAKVKHMAKHVFICRHSVKLFFAVCPRNCTRQTGWHTVNVEFPVVSVGRRTTAFRRASFACIYLAKRYNLSPNCDFFFIEIGRSQP